MLNLDTKSYLDWLNDIKNSIKTAQNRVFLAANAELTILYWNIGRSILEKQTTFGWGSKIIQQLSTDLKKAFPDSNGWSVRNLNYMRAFAESYPNETILQQAAAQLPWFHNCLLINKIKDTEIRLWYAQQAILNGWSRAVLTHHIESDLYKRQGKTTHNFQTTMPNTQSDLAQQTLKDPYIFDFLDLDANTRERDLENALVQHVQEFLLELGTGFAFVGRQYLVQAGDQDFYLDLLFYHLKLRCYVVLEIKTGEFKPEYAGKMNFYLNVADDQLRHPQDQPSIGLILCQTNNKVVAEYALRGLDKSIGISEYLLTKSLPTNLKSSLPTIEELEKGLE